MREMRIPFYCDPALTVAHKKEFGFWYFLTQRYYYSRSFAGMRMRAASFWKRIAYSGGTVLLLPALLFTRITKTVLEKGRHRLKFLLAAPIIGFFLISWAWGEAVGALFGPGDSLARVE